jgi:hypothetical protein
MLLWVHTLLSFLALAAGAVVVVGLLGRRSTDGWTAVFLSSALATSATGFAFPFTSFRVSHWTGVVALLVLGLAFVARYAFRLTGPWRIVYAASMVASLYFLALVGVDQAFQKVPGLTELRQFTVYAQIAVLLLFVLIGLQAARTFRPAGAIAA